MGNPDMSSAMQPWVEKYRPRTVSDVVYQEEVVQALTRSLENASLPHLLFYGPPGTGKTSTALAIARQLFGPEMYKSRVLELNASDERGIGVVRNKIKQFASNAVGQGVSGYPCPPFKILILDEADAMTEDAQNALRRTMEAYSKVTRFCFICNYVSRIIEPITSRCAKFRFKPLGGDITASRMRFICEQEGVACTDELLGALERTSGGDLRKAITTLQSSHRLYGQHISSENIFHVSGLVPDAVLHALWKACRSNRFDLVRKAVADIVKSGYSAPQVFSQFHDQVVESTELSDAQKAAICMGIANADKCLVDGADEQLQLLDVASLTSRALTS
eukprot:jgi/Mesvir1/9701/Mv12178-RA.1